MSQTMSTTEETGNEYQPGQNVGGPDRKLSNGGAVVDGIYIPPGTDFSGFGPQLPADWEEAAKELYGGYYEIIKDNPSLLTLVKEAIRNDWSPEKFRYELQQTEWWKTTVSSDREWQIKKETDPASAQQEVARRVEYVRSEALNLGVRLSDSQLAKLAEDSLRFGWNDQLLSNAIGSEAVRSSGGQTQLVQGFYGQNVRTAASDYGVPVSDSFVNDWVSKIAMGQETQGSYEAYLRDLSKNMYPALSSGFDRGLTFKSMVEPYAQFASRVLEIPTSQMDFTDPKWSTAFNAKDEKGNATTMSYGEWMDYLRSDPKFGWEYTDNARSEVYNVALQLGQMFGRA